VALRGGDAATARGAIERALELAPPNSKLRSVALAISARIAGAEGRAQDALSAAEQAEQVRQSSAGAPVGDAMIRLTHAEALYAVGRLDDARAVLEAAHALILERALKIRDAALRASFLERVPENARIVELARSWRGPG
jgi:hypothetical protein